MPRRVRVLDALPRLGSGKVAKARLVAEGLADTGGRLAAQVVAAQHGDRQGGLGDLFVYRY